ncbi:MAG: rhomboid family intramembrane serine protease [Myxococcota bacterium]|nr:rhomboid family intramembrane serine protease [Myxococcota bacterium]
MEKVRDSVKGPIVMVTILLGVMWGLELVDFVVMGHLDRYGIVPRSWDGLWGILWSPWLHGNFAHLAANTGPFFVLGILVALRGRRDFVLATASIMFLGGMGVWLTGATHSVHIGASGLIFGYFGYLLTIGLVEKSFTGLLVTGLVIVLYGGIIWGVLPTRIGVSWQGHLFGLLAGIWAGRQFGRKGG